MAKRSDSNDKKRKNPFLPDPDEYAFDDDLESVTGKLPTEEEYMPLEEPEEEPPETPVSEGTNRIGIRMIGMRGSDEDPGDEFGPAYDADDEDDLTAPGHAARRGREEEDAADSMDESAPILRTKSKKQQVLDAPVKPKTPFIKAMRIILSVSVTLVLLLCLGAMLLSRTMIPDNKLLQLPEAAVSTAIEPAQNFFSGIVDKFAAYFRQLKMRENLEQAYIDLLAKNEELYQQAVLVDELTFQLATFQDIDEEMQQNLGMNPIRCQVIGREQGNYFSTFTIDRGQRDGIEPYMAVTISGALVGFTEKVYTSSSTVRTIIDSNASISGLIQSSRDQGIVSGTLGINGQPMCRMYYLPDDHLPRPGDIVVTSGVGMSFPKGIPIGTVRESTRGMESNKQYIVIEPAADFEHIEYVIVYRYKPTAEAVEGRSSTATYNQYVPTVTARPYPTLRIGSTLKFGETATPMPTTSATPSPTPTVSPTPSPTPAPTPSSSDSSLEYNSSLLGPTPTPTPSPTPSPTPLITLNPDDFVWEDE